MKNHIATVLCLLLVGCGGSGSNGRSGGITNLDRQILASGMDQPMEYVASTANPHLAYVLERPGVVRALQDDQLLASPVLDISNLVVTQGECGLQGMALAPDFPTSREFYLTYNTSEAGTVHTRVTRYTMSPDGLSASGPFAIVSIPQPFDNHKGGTIHFRDGHLYLMLGDGGSANDPGNRAQDPQSLLGKVLRIDPTGDDFPADPDNNYSIPPDNPFIGIAGVRGEIWDFGVRNPFRWSVDPASGAFTIADVGQDAFEEIDYEPVGAGGRNYGWRLREGLHGTTNAGPPYPIPFTDPYLEYSHAVGEAIIGGFVVRSSGLGLTGRYLVADYITNHLWSAPAGPASTTMAAAREILIPGGWNGIVSIDPDANGQPVVTELNSGTVSRLALAQ